MTLSPSPFGGRWMGGGNAVFLAAGKKKPVILGSPGTSARTDPEVKNIWPWVNLIVDAFLGKIGGSGG